MAIITSFRRLRFPVAAASLAMMTAGCAYENGFPSLSPRKVEDESLAEPVLPSPPAGTPSAVAMADYAPIVARARAADGGFRATLADERGAIAAGRGAATGSDSWLAAQTALSRVEAARAPVTTALSDLERSRNGDAPRTDTGRAAAVASAFDEVLAIDTAERNALAGVMPPN